MEKVASGDRQIRALFQVFHFLSYVILEKLITRYILLSLSTEWQQCIYTLKSCAWVRWGYPGGSDSKESACRFWRQETWVSSLGQEDPLEKGMATHSSILACRIPWTEDPGGLQSVGSQRVGHD